MWEPSIKLLREKKESSRQINCGYQSFDICTLSTMDTNFNFMEICQSTSKALGNDSKAICKVFEEKEFVIKMKSYQYLDICILRSEGKKFNFLEIFQIHFESLGKCYKGHLERIGENKRNYEKILKVIKMLIFPHWDPMVQISSSWTFLKITSKSWGALRGPFVKHLRK